MTCEQARSVLIHAARGRQNPAHEQARRHAAGCSSCQPWFDAQRALTDDLAALAEQAVPPPPAGAEAHLLAELDRRAGRSRQVRAAAVGVGLAALLLLAAFLPHHPDEPPPKPVEAAADLYVLDYAVMTQPLRGSLVRVTLTPEAASNLGLPPLDVSDRGVRAEVLLSEDGAAQAVRLLEPVRLED